MAKFRACLAAAVLAAGCPALSAADLPRLREQLKLATADDATLSRIELLRRIIDADPTDADARRELLTLWLKVEDYDLAEATLNAWPEAPAGVAALTRAKVRRFRDEDAPGAAKILEDYLAGNPQDAEAHEALIEALLTTRDFRRQVTALDGALAQQRTARNLMRRALARQSLGDFTAALADADAAVALDPEDSFVKGNAATFDRLRETLAKLPNLDAAVAKDPEALAPRMERAWWYRYGGLNDRSLSDADAALVKHPDSLAARVARARARWLLDQITSDEAREAEAIDVTQLSALEDVQAVTQADAALAQDPRNLAALRARARGLNAIGQYRLAQRDAQAALAIDARDVKAALEALYAGSHLGEDPSALLRTVEAMNPPGPDLALAYVHLADHHFRAGNLALAVEFADRALVRQESPYALRVKAAALQRMGRIEEARQLTTRADSLSR